MDFGVSGSASRWMQALAKQVFFQCIRRNWMVLVDELGSKRYFYAQDSYDYLGAV